MQLCSSSDTMSNTIKEIQATTRKLQEEQKILGSNAADNLVVGAQNDNILASLKDFDPETAKRQSQQLRVLSARNGRSLRGLLLRYNYLTTEGLARQILGVLDVTNKETRQLTSTIQNAVTTLQAGHNAFIVEDSRRDHQLTALERHFQKLPQALTPAPESALGSTLPESSNIFEALQV